eukprot:scaffold54311_cov63-Phaeocystis_antarctica.AAC.2
MVKVICRPVSWRTWAAAASLLTETPLTATITSLTLSSPDFAAIPSLLSSKIRGCGTSCGYFASVTPSPVLRSGLCRTTVASSVSRYLAHSTAVPLLNDFFPGVNLDISCAVGPQLVRQRPVVAAVWSATELARFGGAFSSDVVAENCSEVRRRNSQGNEWRPTLLE